jgi:hypothetical protein
MAPGDIIINNNLYISGEHAFHGEKFLYCSLLYDNLICRKKELYEYSKLFKGKEPQFKSPYDAKKAGGKKGLLLIEYELNKWNSYSNKLQKQICLYKLYNDPDVMKFLKENKDKYFVHYDFRAHTNTKWGGKIKNNQIIGKNELGNIWNEIKNEL